VPVMVHSRDFAAFVALIDLTQNDLQKKGRELSLSLIK